MDIWNILGIVAILLLIYFSLGGKNAVWGSVSLGVLVGVIAGLIYLFKGDGFNWQLLKKVVIVSTLLGAVFEIVGRLSQKRA